MSTRKVISKKDRYNETKAIIESERPEKIDHEIFMANVKENAGGSISASKGALVGSSALEKWLVDTRSDMKNPFIGKNYMMRASEYETDDKIVFEAEIAELDDALNSDLNDGLEAYDPNTASSPESEDRKDIRVSGGIDRKLIDHCVVMNITRKMISKSDDELLESIDDSLKLHHDDPNYKTEIDVKKSIDKTRYDALRMRISDLSKKSLLIE